MEIELKHSHLLATALILLVLAGGIFWYLRRPKPTPWLNYPTDGQALVTQFMDLIRQDTENAHNQAYQLVNLPDRKKTDDTHLQVYHNIVMYMTMIFGNDWAKDMKVIPLQKDQSYAVQIGTETLHIDLIPQGPPEGPPTNHLGIADIQEFSLDDDGKAVQMAAITSIIGGVGGDAAKANLQGIIGAGANFSRMTPTQRKQTILPVILNPNNQDSRRAMLHLWPIRTDPTIIAILARLKDDQRFAPDVRKTAEQILQNRVDDTELTAIGE